MFVCTKFTQEECMRRRLLGLPRRDLDLVTSCTPGATALFLFNFSSRELHGLFVAASPGRLNWDGDAWKRSLYHRPSARASSSSPFPSQVKFRVVREYSPLHEDAFAHLIRGSNRVTPLDLPTVRELLRLFAKYDTLNAPTNPAAFTPEPITSSFDMGPGTNSIAFLPGGFGGRGPPRGRGDYGLGYGEPVLTLRSGLGGGYGSHGYGEEEGDANAHAAAAAAASVEMLFRLDRDDEYGGDHGLGEDGRYDEEDDSQMCVVCMEQPMDSVLQPCGHAAFCYTCVADLSACPLCAERVVGVLAL